MEMREFNTLLTQMEKEDREKREREELAPPPDSGIWIGVMWAAAFEIGALAMIIVGVWIWRGMR